MARQKAQTSALAPRLTMPTLIGGDWDTAVICTYGADLAFLEDDLWRQLERTRSRIVFADAGQVRRYLWTHRDRRLRHLNRSYVLAPVVTTHAVHAKIILLLRHDAGLLAVGSGNLGYDGYASQGECFTTYRWAPDEQTHLASFVAIRQFIDEVLARDLTDAIVQGRVSQAWSDAPWLYGSTIGSSVHHNLTVPLIDQFIDAIGTDPVDELILQAPFYDARCTAVSELVKRCKPKRLRVLLQEGVTSVDPKQLERAVAAAPAVDIRSAEAQERGTFLHAKFVLARGSGRAVCLQGSPNLSSPALLRTHPDGNIEVANILSGPADAFDHLIDTLTLSEKSVDLASLRLRFVVDDDEASDQASQAEVASELAWMAPRLTGRFARHVEQPPVLLIADRPIDDVAWELEPINESTRFVATLGTNAKALLDRVEAVTFDFGDGATVVPQYPFHLNALAALASGQSRADLLREAGDFAVDDEELEQLLIQLDEVLVVDGRSVWRMLRRPLSKATEDENGPRLAYGDLDWDAIQSHPKLAQYGSWATSSAADSTGLGILLGSIADRFRREVALRSGTQLPEPPADDDILDDLSSPGESETEDDREHEETQRERRRLSARIRARRLFQNFVKRFVNGITDDAFVQLVGPSVILPSYVVFNHLCWKLAQLDLADHVAVVDAQLALWRFFWGEDEEDGYLATLTEPEQVAALELLDRHHAEAVLMASVSQAYEIAWHEADDRLDALRDVWRQVLVHDLWQPTSAALSDAAAVAGVGPDPIPVLNLIDELDGLARYYDENDARRVIATVLGTPTSSVSESEGRVARGELGEQTVDIYVVNDPAVTLTPTTAASVLSELARLRTDVSYLRLTHPPSETVAFADFDTGNFVWADRRSGAIEDIVLDGDDEAPWEAGIGILRGLAA